MSEIIQFPNVALSVASWPTSVTFKVNEGIPTFHRGAATRIQRTPVLRRPIGPSLTLSAASSFVIR